MQPKATPKALERDPAICNQKSLLKAFYKVFCSTKQTHDTWQSSPTAGNSCWCFCFSISRKMCPAFLDVMDPPAPLRRARLAGKNCICVKHKVYLYLYLVALLTAPGAVFPDGGDGTTGWQENRMSSRMGRFIFFLF
jgi:hypothetical protein